MMVGRVAVARSKSTLVRGAPSVVDGQGNDSIPFSLIAGVSAPACSNRS
jgi:hypothetical protein